MTDWKKCKKKPITVEFREVQPNEKGIETLEGFKPCDPAKHYIMKGVRGEIYPIEKEIFDETYDVAEEHPKYTILKEYRVKGTMGFCHKTVFKCDKGTFIASEAADPLGVEVCIMKEKGGFETEPLRRLSTKEAIEKFVRGEWPND